MFQKKLKSKNKKKKKKKPLNKINLLQHKLPIKMSGVCATCIYF